ncbi:MAG TPA: glycoside hydrolase family 15 protein [Nocardioides sp.]|nr:glycoside hydrolase family 15 protein [Nocardioides sp.]
MTAHRSSKPIEDYALIGDQHTAALVARDGSIDWLCLPRFDSPACFAALLDDEDAGCWRLAPTDPEAASTRHYQGETLVLRTRWRTADGEADVTDFMPERGEAADVVRIVDGRHGRVELESDLRLRFEMGRITPWIKDSRDGETAAIAGPEAAWLSSSVPVRTEDGDIRARFTVEAGDRVTFVLTHQKSHRERPKRVHAARALRETVHFWESWMGGCDYDGEWQEPVRRSLLLLKALTYAPTGGILAAATTSLPEEIGGERNWDYRFCWLRDATFALQALLGTGFVEEAKAWREWLVRAVAGDPAKLQVMYRLDGSRRLPEYEDDWLSGYAGSRPVREGNAAAGQLQLDVWGEVLDGLHLARESGMTITHHAWDVQRSLLDWLEGNWRQPDDSLWEVRSERRQFVHSKVMAWAGVDRAVRSVENHGLDGPVDRWRALREEIHREVCDKGFDADRGTFTQFYGSRGLDAALLLIPRVGFLPWDDARVRGTVAAVERELCRDGFLVRYDPDADGGTDGLTGREGAFLACSFWMVDALHGTGREEDARVMFERLLRLRNDVGMLSEEYDVQAGRHLGNTPQAFSLVGLVNSARQLGGSATQTSASGGEQQIAHG